jgi:TRAP-type C4-dicarboxylate transport system permease large subunit
MRSILPFVLTLGAVLLLLTLFPPITLFLPRLFGYI